MTHPAPTELPTKDLFRTPRLADRIPNAGVDNIKATAAANGTKAWYHQLNVTEADAIPPVFDTIREQIRHPLRGLVACTGISGVFDATSYPIDAFRKVIDVNIAGTFLMAQAVGKELHRANLAGSVVLIASMSGWNSNKVRVTSRH
ncbi:uncharacterized protein N0V89_000685 [Didymosphaeria variabile]|uniref:NAD(P)-binding protein n=1 Tax=Didymosphaeria variabile TaxID=1932322 RepID=A0A9W9CG31_9PLEO|nr:uncharacterized protein N0V89_000685 [Didymosphaeria variabile]KAJ4360125.1 hypothetical protein N0V89_000685 [Didymosphaeria variabile]